VGRAADNPVGGWYGLKKACGAGSATTSAGDGKLSASVEHNARNNRMRFT
jgi:hypothetical protein